MKCLLVFAVALAAVRAEEMAVAEEMPVAEEKPVLTYASPLAYAHHPLAYPVAHPYYSPVVYNTHKVVTPVAAPVKEVTYAYQPVETKYVAKPYNVDVHVKEFEPVKTLCKNFLGFSTPCRQKRDTVAVAPAVHHSYVPTVYNVPRVTYPVAYQHPVAYHTPTVVKYKALPTKVHEIEVPTPQLRKVVEKIPLQPLCTNNFGFPVACADNM